MYQIADIESRFKICFFQIFQADIFIDFLRVHQEYRNTLSGHYDIDIPKSICDLGQLSSDSLQNDMKKFAEYLSQWVKNLVEILNSPNKTL